MPLSELPADLRRYILSNVPSVPYLEAVLLLRTDEGKGWETNELARRLYVPDRTGAEIVAQLRSSGIAEDTGSGGGVRYAPPAELRELIDRLAVLYSTDLVAVTDLIHSRIDRRAQQFADAFRFRKE